MRRLLLALVSTVLALVLGSAPAAAPAWAHTRLVSSTPAQGAPVEAPREVVLVFSDRLQPGFSVLSVTGADGGEHVSGTPSPGGDGSSVSQALRSPLEPGTYRVAYRVLAADGHPVTGSFEITAVAPASAVPSPGPGTATAPAAPTPDGTTGALRPAAERGDDGGPPVVALVVAGLVLAGAAGLLVHRLARARSRT